MNIVRRGVVPGRLPRSIHLRFAACLLSSVSLAEPAPAQSPEPVAAAPLPLALNRPAPDMGIDQWLGKKDRPPGVIGTVVNGGEAVGGGEIEQQIQNSLEKFNKALAARRDEKSPGTLAQYHGKVVLVHVIDWASGASSSDLLALIGDLAKANADRGVQPLTIIEQGENSEARARDAAIEWPVAMTTWHGSPSPYLATGERDRAFVIGRSGELVWQGSALADRKGFLRAVSSALAHVAAERIERDLAPELGSALAAYYDGAMARASTLAERVQAEAQRAGSTRLQEDAECLVDKVHESELSWLRAMRAAASRRRDFDEFVMYVDALVAGFPRTSGKEAQDLEKETGKQGRNLMLLKDERAWRECHAQRPVLFPARSDRDGDRFATRVEKFVDDARNGEAVRRAQDLLDRYRVAGR